jgi:hypothetical protein
LTKKLKGRMQWFAVIRFGADFPLALQSDFVHCPAR